jgi:hypothetical protein
VRRHELDVVSLVFGLFFVGVAATWGLTGSGGSWRLPVLLIVVGAVGLATSLLRRSGRDAQLAHQDGLEPGPAEPFLPEPLAPELTPEPLAPEPLAPELTPEPLAPEPPPADATAPSSTPPNRTARDPDPS